MTQKKIQSAFTKAGIPVEVIEVGEWYSACIEFMHYFSVYVERNVYRVEVSLGITCKGMNGGLHLVAHCNKTEQALTPTLKLLWAMYNVHKSLSKIHHEKL